tara:strand:- start:2556 stop:2954 length:399 start_codon:yes stop_codon:yes gene_type:complete
MKKLVFILMLGFALLSCIKNEYEDYEIPEHKYEGEYEQYKAIKVVGFQEVDRSIYCDLLIRYEIDTAKFNIHPANLGHVVISTDGNVLQRIGVENTYSILLNMCSTPRTFELKLTDREGYQVGKETIAVWNK